MASEWNGRVALVTGGARGIGRACCVALARAGADVAVNFRTNRQAAEETAAAVRAAGVRSCVCQADVVEREQVEQMVKDVESELGAVELLVNNAGVFDYVSHEETTPELWQRTLDVNLTGVYHVTWSVKQGMIERRFGRIVNISSISGLRGRPMSIAYATSKAGLIGFTRSLSDALAPYNVRVNAVAPGLIDTEILDGVEPAALERLVDATPMKRIGTPDDIARVVMFLLGEQSSFMTGQTLIASGGRVTT